VRGSWFREARGSAFTPCSSGPFPGAGSWRFWRPCWPGGAVETSLRKVWVSSVCRRAAPARWSSGAARPSIPATRAARRSARGSAWGGAGTAGVGHIAAPAVCPRLLRPVPGAGALWAGKEFQVLLYGLVLSFSAGLFTVSWSAGRLAGGLIGDMQADIWKIALGAVGFSGWSGPPGDGVRSRSSSCGTTSPGETVAMQGRSPTSASRISSSSSPPRGRADPSRSPGTTA